MTDYFAFGQINCDRVITESGELTAAYPGGSAFFALTGMNLYSDSCALVTTTGEDYTDYWGEWYQRNGGTRDYITVEAEECQKNTLIYYNDGKYGASFPTDPFKAAIAHEMRGYLVPKISQLAAAAERGAKGAYVYMSADKVQWRRLLEIIEKTGLQVMWEVNHIPRELPEIKAILEYPVMWSINHFEAEEIFGIERQNVDALLDEIQKITKVACYYRAGGSGAYMVTPDGIWQCPAIDPCGPSVDPTGCGNTSTGAAMYAMAAGNSPERSLVMAAVAAGFNAAQYGPMPIINEETRAAALKAVDENMHLVTRVR